MKQCKGCGYCCIKAACMMGVIHHEALYTIKPNARCPSLYFKNGRYWCDLYDHNKWAEVFGYGCSSPLNTWRKEVKEREGKNEK